MAKNINLTWVNPSTRVDGAVLDASEFTLTLEHAAPGATDWVVLAADLASDTVQFLVENAAEGVHSFRLVAIDTAGVRGDDVMVNITVPVTSTAKPSAPTEFVATLVDA